MSYSVSFELTQSFGLTKSEMDESLWATIVSTDVTDGDFRVDKQVPDLNALRRNLVDAEWSWLKQVHEAEVLDVTYPGEHAGRQADGLITTTPLCPISVTTADCGPLVLVTTSGVAVLHVGWRSLMAEIVEVGASALLSKGGRPLAAHLGPSIAPEDYEFGEIDLVAVADRFGDAVRAETKKGTPALDVHAGISVACEEVGFPAPPRPANTANPEFFSYRTRGDASRQATVAWLHNSPPER